MNKNKYEILLLEKRRYNLKETISFREKYKLWRDYPIQKIIGYIEMANVKIKVNKKVLIPRYETEELILLAIKLIKENGKYHNILDLCCGSGFIGIALKKAFPSLNILQSDISNAAIKQTLINLKINNLKNNVIKSNMFHNIYQKFDVIISNPPYLLKNDKKNMTKSVLKYEPQKALFAQEEGMFFYYQIEKNLSKYLNKNGLIILEINPVNYKWFIDNKYHVINDINNKKRFAYKFFNQF
ncbi:peptide chain release factor N(5)-glutamine methyltransferase [Metamycoplasma sualvi]|uniref:peptide chain release factor N(5)-glutamine methyltransferase n=1 Tax=Metamycoplasma sualvi TaxID=2125 RepID=UPI0038734B9F